VRTACLSCGSRAAARSLEPPVVGRPSSEDGAPHGARRASPRISRTKETPCVTHLAVFVAAALLLGVGAALADSQSAPEKLWSILDLPEFSGTLADVNEVEPNNTCATSESYTYGDVYHAQITAGDQDWVQFSATVGDLLTLGTDADGTPTVDTVIELWRDDCTAMLSPMTTAARHSSLISSYPAPYTGLYISRSGLQFDVGGPVQVHRHALRRRRPLAR
jgi:hypothetical protein